QRAAKVPEKNSNKARFNKNPVSKEIEPSDKEDSEEEGDKTEKTTKKTEVKKRVEIPYVDVPPLTKVTRPATDARAGVATEVSEAVKIGPAFKTKAPVEEDFNPQEIIEEILDMNVLVPIKKLLAGSSLIREGVRKEITKSRKPVTKGEVTVAAFLFAGENNLHDLPQAFKVGGDPYLQLLQEGSKEFPDSMYTGNEAEKLRTVFPKINGVAVEEAILDSGSQIVSMAEAVAIRMGLTWDPRIRVNMESADKSIARTLGMARNVPFRFGELTVYLQAHILKNPAYTILLGRTFDTLTRSKVQNERDGGAILHLEDPNSETCVVVPTYERGKGPRDEETPKQKAEAF
ncbi:hypothetical protein CVT24_007287, partial [Panaeolus cyanescens]